MARFADIDGDGQAELIVGTDYWHDYWPHGKEWNEPGYRAFDAAGRWLGGPLRGFAYRFLNEGTLAEPKLSRGVPIKAGDHALEVFGQLAPAFGDFSGTGRADVVCGEFLNVLHHASGNGDGSFAPPTLIKDGTGADIRLEHCIHFPCAVDWHRSGKLDLLVGAEDGYVTLLKNTGALQGGHPVFEPQIAVDTSLPQIHAGVLAVPAAHDFSGNGLLDLVVGTSQGELLFYENIGTAGEPLFQRDVALHADGNRIRIAAGHPGSIQGPSETRFGYTCPTIVDWDGDGRPDIVMSDVTGLHRFYRNAGGTTPPTFEAGRLLRFQGKPLKTVWRVRPAVTDWTGRGGLSYLTLDEEGVLASYDRLDDVELGNKSPLCWTDGEPIRFTEDIGGGMGRMKLCICDWTGSGTKDLLVGTHGRASIPPGPEGQPRHTTGQAAVLFLENVGGNEDPVFARPRPIRFRSAPVAMGMHACSPEAVDWRGNGTLDLIVGIEDGSIVWLKREELDW